MKNSGSAFITGIIFGLGLGIAGMTQPEKVVGFLDIFGDWDPTLMFVMMGSIMVHSITYHLIKRRPSPLFSTKWHVPSTKQITPALIMGSTLFGLGWGLAGYCPGPAVTSLASLDHKPILFVISMLAGMWAFRLFDKLVKVQP